MLRAVRFAASLNLVIESATWDVLCELSSTISRAAPARLYEEILKLFLLGSARPGFDLLNNGGLLAALFPRLSKWLSENSRHLTSLHSHLEHLDRLYRSGTLPSPSLFLAALFGPSLEEEALARHRGGVPRQQALDATCAIFLEELCKTVCIPARVGGRMRGILAFQPSLQKMPLRRPSSLVSRLDFADAMEYLRLTAETRGENRTALKWWDAFLSKAPSPMGSEPSINEAPAKRRRKRRRRPRPAAPAAF